MDVQTVKRIARETAINPLWEADIISYDAAYGLLDVSVKSSGSVISGVKVLDHIDACALVKGRQCLICREDSGSYICLGTYKVDGAKIAGAAAYNGVLQILDEPYRSSAWDASAKDESDTGIVDLSAVFGLPNEISAVYVTLSMTDANVGTFVALSRDDTGGYAVKAVTTVANVEAEMSGIVPCDLNGNIYITLDCGLPETTDIDSVTIKIWGYVPKEA